MTPQFLWLFFSLSGRVDRKTYVLASALSYIARMLPFYQVLRYPPDAAQSEFWSFVFIVALIVSLWANIALTVKRLHDADKPGTLAVITILLDLLAVIWFAAMRGTPGPNRYGGRTNSPSLQE